jgi:tetratricopeptide (TPR) repeat protein
LRVFRDDTSLSATPQLWPSIEQALGNSRFLILLASPEAAASPWVNKEVVYWLEHKSADKLLIALTDGELSWDGTVGDFAAGENAPLPPVLTGRFAAEPKWIDLRVYRDGADKRDARFTEHAADFAAAIHGMPKEDLLSQEVRQQRRALRLAWSAAGSLVLLAALAGWQWRQADAARQVALVAERVAVEQREAARKQRDTAEWQRGIAEKERARAERNYAAARATVNSLIRDVARGMRNVEGLRGETIARVLDTVKGTTDQLAKTNPDDPLLEQSRVEMYGQFSATYMTAGDRVRALQAANEMLTIARRLSERAPLAVGHRRNIASAQVMIGYLHLLSGDHAVAETSYQEAASIIRDLLARDAARDEWRVDLAFALDKIGELRGRQGDTNGAYVANAEALELRRNMAARNPSQQYWVAISLDRIGKLKQQAKELEAAAAALAESLAITRRLLARDPTSTQLQRDLALSLRSNGDLDRDRGRAQEAVAVYEESLALERRLAKLDPGNVNWQQGLGISLDRVAAARHVTGDTVGARATYEEALNVFRGLHKRDRSNSTYLASLIILLSKVGEIAESQADAARARTAYHEWLDHLENRIAADPKNPNWQVDKVQPLFRLARVGDNAREHLVQARDILGHAKTNGTLSARQESWIAQVDRALAALSAAEARGPAAGPPPVR